MQLDDRVTLATPEGVVLDLVLAGLGSRFLARLLDTLLQFGVIIALLLVLAASGGPGWVQAIIYVLIFATFFGYDVMFETLNNGRTLGKQAAGIRVVGNGGEPVRLLSSAIRNIIRVVDFLPALYLAGAITIVASEHDQRLGDLAAGTIVVRDRFPGMSYQPAPITVPASAVETWDVSAIDAYEVQAIRQFLERRLALPWPVRAHFAADLVGRIAPKVAGVPAGSHPEYVLEGIVVAKHGRA